MFRRYKITDRILLVIKDKCIIKPREKWIKLVNLTLTVLE